jgi:serine/threonine protein kinase
LIEGHTVELLLASRDVPVPEVVAILRDVSDILATSHRRGLVHGHVAPASIVYPAHPRRFRLCLVDWVSARTHDSKTPLPLVVGSPYVAPEQANAIAVTERSDVYSLGKIGRALLERAHVDDVSPLLVTLLESMTAESPSARPRSSDVHSTASWLLKELAPQLDAEPEPERGALITSEAAPTVSGEIRLPPEPFTK